MASGWKTIAAAPRGRIPGPASRAIAAVVIANEFVDALPVSQFVKDRDGWHGRMVGLADDKLAFLAAPDPMPGVPATDAKPGTILERRHDRPRQPGPARWRGDRLTGTRP